jgi:tRNA nucleotidyltransferase (CCA-adding enzyme)
MFHLAPLMDKLARERVFDELCKLLPLVSAADLLTFAPILTQVIPELAPSLGFDQHNPHHAYDVFTHIAHVVEATAPELALRWAALLHDVGKPACFTLDDAGKGHFLGHAGKSADMADSILLRLKAPTALRSQVGVLIRQHMTKINPEAPAVRRAMSRMGSETLRQLLLLQEADMGSKGTGHPQEMEQFPILRQLMTQIEAENACLSIKDLAVNGHDLMSLGYAGPAIGQALQFLLEQVLDEKVDNTKDALMHALQNR